LAWPSPEPVALTLRSGTSTLELPVRPPRAEDSNLPPFAEPEAAPATEHTKLKRMPLRRTIEIDLATGEMVYTLHGDGGEFGGASLARIEDIDLELGYTIHRRYSINENDPLAAQAEFVQTSQMRRGEWSIRVEARTRLSATAESFWFTGDLEAFEGEQRFAQRNWDLTLPRRLV